MTPLTRRAAAAALVSGLVTLAAPPIEAQSPQTRAAVLSSKWTPLALKSSLCAGWDTRLRPDLITHSGGAVSSWRDMVAGYDAVQATGAAKPVFGNGWVYGDGVDDELTLAPVPSGIPTGATACEEWWLIDQQSLVADTTTRVFGSWGGVNAATSRNARRSVVSGVNRANVRDTGGTALTNALVDFSGRHVVRIIATGTQIDIEVDGISAGAAAQVSAIGTTRLRFFADTVNVAGSFALCGIAARYITLLLSGTQAARMYPFMRL